MAAAFGGKVGWVDELGGSELSSFSGKWFILSQMGWAERMP